MNLASLKIKIYADGADLPTMLRLNADPLIKGLTTNPTLMRKAGITDYEKFARSVLEQVTEKPLSLEVFADDEDEMERQARKIASWGSNVYVKIPITNSQGLSTLRIINNLSESGVKVNVTAILTPAQVAGASTFLSPETPSIISIFNGRIMDTGSHPLAHQAKAPNQEILWASTREPWNIWQANAMGYDIITVPAAILDKAKEMQGKNLAELSLDTVRMFVRDGAGYSL